mgnify:FL=1
MIVAYFGSSDSAKAWGLTQWDYGQDLQLATDGEIPDGTEVQFYQDLLTSVAYTVGGIIRIPDVMLQNAKTITAYVYVRSEDEGETILTVTLPIQPRPRPSNYVLPAYEEYARLLPVGGSPGQVPVRTENGIEWGNAADDMQLTDGVLQLLSAGNPIGQRIRLPSGEGSGREVELKNNGTAIQWRYTNENEWHDLVLLADLRGEDGQTPEFEIREGHLFAIYQE